MTERPRDVFDDVCGGLAVLLAGEGFAYSRTRHSLSRRRGEWTHRVAFQSSHSNIAGSVVTLWCHVAVDNARLKKWREANMSPFRAKGAFVAGGGIWNLSRTPPGSIGWNLADSSQRADTIAEIGRAIAQVALPFVEVASDPAGLCRRGMVEDVPLVQLAAATELALCYLGPSAADGLLRKWIGRHANAVEEARQRLAHLRTGAPIGKHRETYASQIALLLFSHELPEAEAAVAAPAPSLPAR